MSPEERARDLVDSFYGEHSEVMDHSPDVVNLNLELEALIASAIREAEASARNEALEEAAAYVEDNSDAYDCWASASAIRNLKTKD